MKPKRMSAPPLRLFGSLLLTLLLPTLLAVHGRAEQPSLERGFNLLYDLEFISAQQQFSQFQQIHPDDPLGPVSEAAGILFAQLNRLGILESQLFVSDASFRRLHKQQSDPAAYRRFDSALKRAQALAEKRLAVDSNDHDALFAIALEHGLRADYASLIEDRQMDALRYTRQATRSAQSLLAVCKDCYDAYVATGISGYLIGSLSAPIRWALRVGGFSGDKQKSIAQLQLAAEHGHYLAPFARILLSIAYLREKDPNRARQLLLQLHNEYPQNKLFTEEIARLDSPPTK